MSQSIKEQIEETEKMIFCLMSQIDNKVKSKNDIEQTTNVRYYNLSNMMDHLFGITLDELQDQYNNEDYKTDPRYIISSHKYKDFMNMFRDNTKSLLILMSEIDNKVKSKNDMEQTTNVRYYNLSNMMNRLFRITLDELQDQYNNKDYKTDPRYILSSKRYLDTMNMLRENTKSLLTAHTALTKYYAKLKALQQQLE